MSHKKKTEEANNLIEKKHYHSKFIATKENHAKVKNLSINHEKNQ